MQEPPQKITGTVRIDAPCPTEIHPDVTIVLRECNEFIGVGIGNVHQDKLGVNVTRKEVAHISSGNSTYGHPIVSSVVAGMNLERKVVFD